jgi:hypothetical protein
MDWQGGPEKLVLGSQIKNSRRRTRTVWFAVDMRWIGDEHASKAFIADWRNRTTSCQ